MTAAPLYLRRTRGNAAGSGDGAQEQGVRTTLDWTLCGKEGKPTIRMQRSFTPWTVLSLATFAWLAFAHAASGQVIEILEGASYGPVVLLPETEVIFGYTIMCAADLPWGSDPCPARPAASLVAVRSADGAQEDTEWPEGSGTAFNFGALWDLDASALSDEESGAWGAVAPLSSGTWALFARLIPHWAFDGEVAVRVAYGPPAPGQPFVPLSSQPVELMRFLSPVVEDLYVEIKVTNRYSIPQSGGYLLGVEFRVQKVK